MFLDSFETDRGIWVQACIGLPFVGQAPGFGEVLSAILATRAAVPQLNLSFRLTVNCSGELRRTVILLAPESSGTALRRFTASFSRLELVTPGSVVLPYAASVVDEELSAFPAEQVRAVPSGFGHEQVWFASHFRVCEFLDELILEARLLGYDFSYQAQLRPLDERTQALRIARHNLLQAQSLVGIPAVVLTSQQHLTERLARASYLIEEFAAVAPGYGQPWLISALNRLFSAGHSQFGSPDFKSGDYSELLASGFHSSLFQAAPPDEICTMAAGDDEIVRLFSWQPGRALSAELKIPERPPEAVELASSARNGPAHYSGSGEYVFVSYRHSDLETILPFLRDLEEAGVRFWYDRGIPGSAEWMEVLEERIEHAELLVVFLSQPAVDSKYVRREILMADTLNKPILTLTLGTPELRWGLKLLLPQYQMQDAHAQPASAAVKQALAARRETAKAHGV